MQRCVCVRERGCEEAGASQREVYSMTARGVVRALSTATTLPSKRVDVTHVIQPPTPLELSGGGDKWE